MPVSTPPSDLPPPPPGSVPSPPAPANPPTQVAGQQVTPSTPVPHVQGAYPVAATGPKTNSLAVISLICGIGSFFAHIIPGVGGATVAIIAVITGFMARNQIRQSGEQGMGMATAGMIIGIIHLAVLALVVLLLIFLIFGLGIAMFGFSRH